MSDFYAIDGRIVPAEDARISVLDLGFLRGVGAFETLRTYGGGWPHALGEHLRRLWDSAAAIDIAPFFAETTVRRLIADIRAKSGHDEMRINLVVTPGEHTSGVFGSAKPTWVMICRDLHAPPPEQYQRGISVITFAAVRHLPEFKTTNYLSGKRGISLAERAGAHEALYVDPDGRVTEGVTSNVLALKGSVITSPCSGCLAGITKAGLRPLAEAEGLRWSERDLHRDDLYNADEVWITSAVREMLPVVRVDDRSIAGGVPGPWAGRLRDAYHRRCAEEARRDAGVTT